MKKIIPFLILAIAFCFKANAQMAEYEYVQDGEFGITGGVAHYFGDLDNRANLKDPKINLGAYYRKQLGNYIAVRLTGNFCQLGYTDQYSNNIVQQERNLSFNTNIFEVAARGDFNFFKFIPTDPNHIFTPYATIGVGVFSYNPYAYYNGQKVYLRPLHTEGETFYEHRKEYGTMAMCFPIGFGIKYAITPKVNITCELAYRFTNTDYIDDVSSTYIGVNNFPTPSSGTQSLAAILQDRSNETGNGTPIGIQGRQRGSGNKYDSYAIAEVGISFNLTSYHCPSSLQ